MTEHNTPYRRNLHIMHDANKFTNGAIAQFEKYYPGQNVYVILLNSGHEPKFTTTHEALYVYNIRDAHLQKNIQHLIRSNKVQNLFIHYLDNLKAVLANKILDTLSLKFYWIFYGGDLYGYLQQYHGYDILDEPDKAPKQRFIHGFIKDFKYLLWFGMTTKQAMSKAFHRIDYFCFWNEYDFELYQSHFKTHAIFRSFIYYHALGDPEVQDPDKDDLILLNHSASPSGNHPHVLSLLQQLGLAATEYKLLMPLSYGDQAYINHVIAEAQGLFGEQVQILRDFMPLHEYQAKLAKVKVAIFGMRRQEAAGNIFQLLNMGAKVFLREDNTLLKWLRKRGFIVFSIERDMYDIHQLTQLSEADTAHNRSCYLRQFNTTVFSEAMNHLIDG